MGDVAVVTRRKIISSLIFKFADQMATYGVSFIVGVILARLLSPDEYGIIAILMIFINIAQIFVQGGFGKALIQKENVGEVDYSSVFYVTLLMSAVFYGIMFFAAPYIADFYKMPELVILMRYLALVLIPNSYNSIQVAKISKEMDFKQFLIRTLISTSISGVIGVAFAYGGFGVWALIAQQLSLSVCACIVMTFAVKWRPKLMFSFNRVKGLFSFGYKMLLSSFLDTLYYELSGLIIGKKYSSSDLAYYNRGMQYPKMLVDGLNGSIISVMFPAFSLVQDNPAQMKQMVRRSLTVSSFVVFPAMAGLAATARPLVELLLTEKWLPCVPYLMISCGIYAFYPIHSTNLQAMAAMGRSDLFLKLEIIKKSYGLIILAIAVLCFDTPLAIMLGSFVSVPISSVVNAFPNKRLLGYSIKDQVLDIIPTLAISFVMGAAVFAVSLLGFGDIATLAIQLPTGVLLYLSLAWVFRVEALRYIVNLSIPHIKRLFEKTTS